MVRVFLETIPGYEDLPRGVLEGQVLATSRAALELFKRLIWEPDLPTDEDLQGFRESARNRASEGLPLADVLHAYRVGGQLGWSAVVETAETGREREALLATAALVMAYVDRLSSVVAETYLAERQHLVSEATRLSSELIEALTSSRQISGALRSFATDLGFPITESYRPFALTILEAPAHIHSQMAASLRLQGILALTEGDGVVGLTKPDEARASFDIGRVLLALGKPTVRTSLRLALEDTRSILSLARRSGHQAGVIDPSDLALPLLLEHSPAIATELRQRLIQPLETPNGGSKGDLLNTLKVYFAEHLNRGRTAQALHIHPNTLTYRLRRVEKLCGVRLSATPDIARLELALTEFERTPL